MIWRLIMHLEIWAIWLCSTTIELTHSNWLINDDSFRCTRYHRHHQHVCYLWMQHYYMQRYYNCPFYGWKRAYLGSIQFKDRSRDFRYNIFYHSCNHHRRHHLVFHRFEQQRHKFLVRKTTNQWKELFHKWIGFQLLAQCHQYYLEIIN